MKISAIILAAGQGLRMGSPLPKSLHPVAGEAIIRRIVRALSFCRDTHIVVSPKVESLISAALTSFSPFFHLQKEPKGTADALQSVDFQVLSEDILVLNGDHPLIEESELKQMWEYFNQSDAQLCFAVAKVKNPSGYGRVCRDKDGHIAAIREESECDADALKIKEVNTGIFFIKKSCLLEMLPRLNRRSAKGELYLTDLVQVCCEQGYLVETFNSSSELAFGVNSGEQLARASQKVFLDNAKHWMSQGVIIVDPPSTYIESEVVIGSASVIYPGVYIKRGTSLGSFCVVEMNSYLHGCKLGNGVQVKAHSYIEMSEISDKVSVGPFARIRQGCFLDKDSKVGSFVELKKAHLGQESKVPHLSYVGDATVGDGANVGAGTITCNYAVDRKKYETSIGKSAFIGSGVQLVAPVKVGDHAVVGAGSVVREDVKDSSLFVSRGESIVKEDYRAE